MPMIGGRYYMNPNYGRSMEQARDEDAKTSGARISQEDAGYEPADHCADCTHFRPGEDGQENSCELVEGTIDPQFWCKLYEESPEAQTQEPNEPESEPGQERNQGPRGGKL